MASSAKGGGEKDRGLQEDPLVAALVPDPSAGPPDATVLHGYLGKSTTANCWRLYLDAALTSYVEVSADDILHHTQIADDGGTVVWVPKSLELTVTKVSSTTIQAEFLSGAIAAGRMQPTASAKSAFAGDFARARGFQSIPVHQCVSNILGCPSDACPTWNNCPPPPTVTDWCRPSEFAPLCGLFGLP
jgi:hypothetical protein